jgi:hypothetical protein
MINQELKPGDRIKLLFMEDETSIEPGMEGTVTGVLQIFGDTQYNVDWDNGSKLALISGVDAWTKAKPKKIIESSNLEGMSEKNKYFSENVDLFQNFKMKFLKDYLLTLRDCGVTNMLGASPYLYMGKDRMKINFSYHNVENEICDEVLEKSNLAQAEMIAGVIKLLESKNKEVSLENINRYLRTYSQKILMMYINLF